MKIGITGASGLIGAEVASRLTDRHELVKLGRRQSDDVLIDMGDPVSISEINLPRCDALVHCAGVVDEDFKNDAATAFIHATVSLEELIQRATASGVKIIVYFSTAHVYGSLEGVVSESSPPSPISDYAIAHFASEQILRRAAIAGGAQVLIIRPNAVFGIPQNMELFDRWWLIPYSFPISAVRDNEIILRSPGASRRNFVSIVDLAGYADAFISNANKYPRFTTLNPVGKQSLSIREFAKLCAAVSEDVTGTKCTVVAPDPIEYEAGSNFEYVSSVQLYEPTTLIEEYLRKLIPILARGDVEIS